MRKERGKNAEENRKDCAVFRAVSEALTGQDTKRHDNKQDNGARGTKPAELWISRDLLRKGA